MLKNYYGRIIATTFFIIAFSVWNIIYYGLNGYRFNIFLDSSYTFILAIIVWWLGSYFDRSKLLYENLRKSEENIKKLLDETDYIFDNLDQVVFQTDKSGQITKLNQAWVNLTGYKVHECIGSQLTFFIYHEDEWIGNKMFSDLTASKKSTMRQELRLRKIEGGYVLVEMNCKVTYDSFGQLFSTVGTFTDITERKQSEQEILQLNENLAKRSEKLRVVSQLSAAIAHEVRNPLTSISGFIQLLNEQKQIDHEYIEIILKEIAKIELVIADLLTLSKPQTVTLKKYDLIQIIDYVLTLIKPMAQKHRIVIKFNKADTPIWVLAEENQLKLVFINIIKNAIEAINYEGVIEIVPSLACHDFVSIYIKDNGPGIPEEIIKHIGQPFYSTKDKGTGLGLTTCFKIIEIHKGKIHITSQVKKGTTIELILPQYLRDE
ncbi:ATP-binding protein [Heyndrickxia oleronia]|jgi:PAS domain S-box-containing protein|uniref:histidine kinase n=1 Tax=Heyndrickxia oleronia TaxID=38875 RepID=A0A8E2LC07_9BACI|nr:ATP-binding protein [Heyndrickxia oleronia]MEC1374278.1 ATP-binding protein [Heyndrickxia oleronia]NYV64993.1 PAS domain S-box protein [Bacillus sp. Gen3]OOP66505.1 PAS domain-containing sensor histidine kinase [Heyndrickxia oleronia]QQZ07129.1 PAS domain S-box protein [Heyndrickxia oleronia]